MKVFGLCVNCIICSLDFSYTEAVVRRFSSEQVLLNISQSWSFFLIKLLAFIVQACNFIEKRLQHRYFSLKFAKSLRASFLQNTYGGCFLCLEISYELSAYCIMRMMNRFIVWYVLALQHLFHFIACVSFLSISFSFFYFFRGFYFLFRYWDKFANISNKALELFLDS